MKNDSPKRSRPPIFLPLLITLGLTVFVWVTRIDFRVADLFFNETSNTWFLKSNRIVQWIYEFSPIPAMVVWVFSAVVALGSIWKKNWRRFTRRAICWMLVLALGPGLVVNFIFKDRYGRPRPKQVEQYGGKMTFCPVWVRGHETGKAKSFPCGHASIGFYFMAGYFCWWRRNRRRARGWLGTGLVAGSIVGLSRMASGAHWFSDVVWAGVFIYFLSYLSAWSCGLLRDQPEISE